MFVCTGEHMPERPKKPAEMPISPQLKTFSCFLLVRIHRACYTLKGSKFPRTLRSML